MTLTMLGDFRSARFGWNTPSPISTPAKPFRLPTVQANIPPRNEKFDPQFAYQIFEKFTRLSNMALQIQPPPDLLVWPESAMPGPVQQDPVSRDFVMNIAATTSADLLLGTIDLEGEHDYNAAMLVSENGRKVQLYRKLHLVPFGEYVPGRHTVPLLARLVGDQVPGDFNVGTQYTVFGLTDPGVRVAPLICFEDTIGDLTRRFVLEGANLLANVTNDGWFLHSAGSHQHLANAVFRCVETRRPMVRAANTGITCFINEFGRVTQMLRDESGSTFGEGILAGEVNVPADGFLTFYTRHGEWVGQLSAVLAVLAILWGYWISPGEAWRRIQMTSGLHRRAFPSRSEAMNPSSR